MENLPQPQWQGCTSCKEKLSQKGTLLGKMLLQFPLGSSPDRVESLTLPLILLKRLPSHFYNKRIMNTLTRIRGALCLTRWRKGTTRFIGLCGFDGLTHQIQKTIRH